MDHFAGLDVLVRTLAAPRPLPPVMIIFAKVSRGKNADAL